MYPTNAEVATEVIHMPASSGSVERIFRTAGLIYKPIRRRLSDKRFEQLMFIKCNTVVLKLIKKRIK